jgi:hypothetical protein
MNWKYFAGACLIVGAALYKAGAPAIAIAAGLGLAALVTGLRHRTQLRAGQSTLPSDRKDKCMHEK